jgi:hypothetical protein
VHIELELANLIGRESLWCLLKILAKDRMARKKAILVSTFLRKLVRTFGLDFEEAQALTTYQLAHFLTHFFVFRRNCVDIFKRSIHVAPMERTLYKAVAKVSRYALINLFKKKKKKRPR